VIKKPSRFAPAASGQPGQGDHELRDSLTVTGRSR
jgi:hypothetical protein